MFCTIKIRRALAGILGAAAAIVVTAGISIGILAAIQVDALVEQAEAVQVPIIMYHGLLKEEKKQGRYVISPDLFEQDLKYLQENGYTTIVMADLLEYVYNGKDLPVNPVMITFDDGYYNNYLYAYPLLKQYNSRMVLSPIGRYIDEYTQNGDTNPNYAQCNWEAIREMMDSGLVEIQNHSYNLHSVDQGRKGAQKKVVESVAEYQSLLEEDLAKMQRRMEEETGYIPTTFTYPFGAVSKESLPVLKEMGFRATLVCESRVNQITRDPECLYGLGRYLRTNQGSSEVFFKKILPKKE